MIYTAKTFNIPTLTGISQTNIDEHLKLYSGYVKHYNLIQSISENSKPESNQEHLSYAKSEVSRRLSFEWNGIKNHEYYFQQLEGGAKILNPESKLSQKISATFGSISAWTTSFQTLAKTRGIGWAILWRDRETNELIQSWVDEQHLGQLNSCDIIFALDVWEHSYVADYQPSGKGNYITDYFANVNWSVCESRFE